MTHRCLAVFNGVNQFRMSKIGALVDERVLDGLFARTGYIRVAEAMRELRNFAPNDFLGCEIPDLCFQSFDDPFLVGQIVPDCIVETPEQRMVQNRRMVGGGDHKAVGIILLDHLKEAVHDAANLADVVADAPRRTGAVEFIEQIDAACLAERFEDQTQFRCGFAHELRDEAIKPRHEKRQTKLTG
jgi:hypothetical protein